jgi:hypothetical protein
VLTRKELENPARSGGDAIGSDAHESALSVRAKHGDDGLLGACAREERLPREQMLGAVEVAGRDPRQLLLSDPVEAIVAVEELEPVDCACRPLGILGEPGGSARRGCCGGERIGMGCDQRRSCCPRFAERGIEPAVDRDEPPVNLLVGRG